VILPILPLSHVFLGLLALAWRRSARMTFIVSLLIDAVMIGLYSAGSGWFKPLMIGGWDVPIGIAVSFDPVSLAFLVLAIGLEFAVIQYIWGEKHRPYFFMLLHVLFGATYALIVAKDLFNIYVILELLSLTSFLLVAYDRQPRQIWASLKYLLFASVGMSVFLLGGAIAYGYVGSFNLSEIQAVVAGSPDAPWIAVSASLLFAGVAVKAGIFSSSLWLPAAHSSAPTVISALLSGLVIKMGFVVIIRLHEVFRFDLPLLVFGALTGIIGAAYAIASTDIKRLLALSTLSQIGYLLLGLRIGGEEAMTGVLAYAVAHGWSKGLLFLSAGECARAAGSTRIGTLISARGRIPSAARVGLLVGTLGVGTGAAFAKLIPLFDPRVRVNTGSSPRRTAIWTLGLPVVSFLLIAWGLFGRAAVLSAWNGWAAAKAFATIGIGILAGRLFLRRPLHLPERVFQVEPGMISILAGFIVVYLLISLG